MTLPINEPRCAGQMHPVRRIPRVLCFWCKRRQAIFVDDHRIRYTSIMPALKITDSGQSCVNHIKADE